MTSEPLNGIVRNEKTQVGLLLKLWGGFHFGLMIWDYQKHDVDEKGWMVFMLDENWNPHLNWDGKPRINYINSLSIEVIGTAHNNKIESETDNELIIKFKR